MRAPRYNEKDLSGQRFGKLIVIERVPNDNSKWRCVCDCGGERNVVTGNLTTGHTTHCKECRKHFYKDLTGLRFGKLVAVEKVDNIKGRCGWNCICDCGNERVYSSNSLLIGRTVSCGCKRKEVNIDLAGKRFERLLVLERVPSNRKNGGGIWKCLCDCGNISFPGTAELNSGNTKSCGCYGRDNNRTSPEHLTVTEKFHAYKSSAKVRKLDFQMTRERFKELIFSKCYYCGRVPYSEKKLYKRDKSGMSIEGSIMSNGIDRVNNDVGYIEGNMVPCCTECNFLKGIYDYDYFCNLITMIANNLKGASEEAPVSCQ